jgi:hypothetical protein
MKVVEEAKIVERVFYANQPGYLYVAGPLLPPTETPTTKETKMIRCQQTDQKRTRGLPFKPSFDGLSPSPSFD